MDFFAHQEAAKRQTSRLVGYFFAAVVSIIVALYLVAALLLTYAEAESGEPTGPATLWNPELLAMVAGGTLIVILAGSLFKIAALRGGGKSVAESLGGRLVQPGSRDAHERRLLNVVEEMAIASGMPVPPVYVLRDEAGINAFAAGFGTDDAVVAVTRGTLVRLSRDELQGVIAHEFSHILNGDMRLNIRLMGVLHGILLIGLLGRGALRSMRFRSRSRKGGGAIILFAVALFAIGYIGVFFGRLIKAAVSRQREFLADAAAVQFTRNPDGIAGALKKIGGLAAGSSLQSPEAETASHLFFANGMLGFAAGLMATHPPLRERILRIQPRWDGSHPALPVEPPATVPTDDSRASGLAGTAPRTVAGQKADAEPSSFALTPEHAVAAAGAPTPAHLAYAQALLARIPAHVLETAHEPFGARALVYAVLIAGAGPDRQKQVAMLEGRADPEVLRVFRHLLPMVDDIGQQDRLPLVNLCLPALRTLSLPQFADFRFSLVRLIEADRIRSPFELALLAVVRRHLDSYFDDRRPWRVRRRSSGTIARQSGVLLSALAHIGHDTPETAAAAYRAGIARLATDKPPELQPAGAVGPGVVGDALDTLVRAAPDAKRRLVLALTAAVVSDGKVTPAEGEILRAVFESLDVPMPPFLADALAGGR
ncbi:MAG: M48 family metallopeptidase [Inquilinus sp.]|nr:M48 family metallopeptidase [Inquilinus sp.]